MKAFVSIDFTGHWPVGVAAIIIANDADEATALITLELKEHGLQFDGSLREINTQSPKAFVLLNGEY